MRLLELSHFRLARQHEYNIDGMPWLPTSLHPKRPMPLSQKHLMQLRQPEVVVHAWLSSGLITAHGLWISLPCRDTPPNIQYPCNALVTHQKGSEALRWYGPAVRCWHASLSDRSQLQVAAWLPSCHPQHRLLYTGASVLITGASPGGTILPPPASSSANSQTSRRPVQH